LDIKEGGEKIKTKGKGGGQGGPLLKESKWGG